MKTIKETKILYISNDNGQTSCNKHKVNFGAKHNWKAFSENQYDENGKEYLLKCELC